MNVEAVRDDGALLVSAGGRGGVIVSREGVWPTSVGAALARGEWTDPSPSDVIPAELRTHVREALERAEAFLPPLPTFLAPALETGSTADVTAALGEHTGAMIALVPSDADAERLAVDGGEDSDELHVTLGYLGEAALIPEEVKHALIECVSRCVSDWPTIVGDAFGVSMFNPEQTEDVTAGGGEPCVVLLIAGQQLPVIHKDVMTDVSQTFAAAGMELHPQHSPWVAHLTLAYTGDADLSYFTDRVGPVTFDRVRLAFGDDMYDIPLGDWGDEESEVSEESDYVAADFQRERDVNAPGGGHNLRNYWVRGEGAAKIGWGTDGSFARCVSLLGEHVKNPQGLCAEYHKAATGEWPAEKGVPSHADVEAWYTDTAREDITVTKYADPGYQDDGVKRYPLDTEAHIRAAWSYINMPRNAAKYDTEDLDRVKARIKRAMEAIGADVSAEIETLVARGGDCPPGHHMMASGECMSDSEMDTDVETDDYQLSDDTAPWNGVLTVEGVESGDGRMFAGQALSWDEPPLPLMWQKETSHGGGTDVSVRVGSIERIWREPDPSGRADVFIIRGEGQLDLGNPDGAEVHRRMGKKMLRGNSVDVDSVKQADVELSYPELPMQSEGGDALSAMFAQPELTTYRKGRIRATTLCEIPAFTEARLELTDAVTASADDCAECEQPDEIREALDALTAATSVITIPDTPPREWFREPSDVSPLGALTVTDEGRVYGYVAPAGVRHRSFQQKSVYVPLRNVDYSRFHGGETIVADGGRVSTGNITMNCGHATTAVKLSGAKAAEHYDNTCSVVATACVGENEHGVWIAGALLPDVDVAMVRRMMACRLSGDWRTHLDRHGWREFVAALLVPVPGFPMARVAPSVEIAEGELVASSVPVRMLIGDQPLALRARVQAAAERIGRDTSSRRAAAVARVRSHRVAALSARVHGDSTQAFLFRKSQKRGNDGRWVDEGLGDPDDATLANYQSMKEDDFLGLEGIAAKLPDGGVLLHRTESTDGGWTEFDYRVVKRSGRTPQDVVLDVESRSPDVGSGDWEVSERDVKPSQLMDHDWFKQAGSW